MRSVDPPKTNTTGGPSPNRSKAMVVPSLEVTVFMKLPFRFVYAIWIRRHAVLPCSFHPVGRPCSGAASPASALQRRLAHPLQKLEAHCSSLEPLSLHPDCRVDADLPEPPGTRAYELVRRPGRNDDDLSRRRLECLLAEGEAHLPIQNYERLFVWVPVQLRSRAGPVAADKERDACPVLVAVEPGGVLTAREPVDVDHVVASFAGHWVSFR